MTENLPAGRYDPLSRQRSLGDEERARLHDNALTDRAKQGSSIREHIKEAIAEHRPEPLGNWDAAVDFYGRHGHVREELAKPERERDIARDRHPNPDERKPLTFAQQAKITMRGLEHLHNNGVTPENLKEAGRYQREYREVRSSTTPQQQHLMQLALRDAQLGERSILTRAERHLIEWNPRNGNYSAAGLRKVIERRLARQR